ncbi:MotE family protein [Roseobacter sp. EG26]|uniref:MotE family protein n=1 Tax=Roseobacter sp. EG26 TaxID=3412477 RepID=UPI003CE4AA11
MINLSFGGRNGRGSILLIAGLLIASAALRVSSGAGQAIATENPMAPAEEMAEAKNNTPSLTKAEKADMSNMLRAFQDREQRISEREIQIDMRMKALAVADEEIERRLTVLQDAEETLKGLLALANTAAEDDLARLTSVYENMKPKDAAPLFEEMEPAFAAGFLGRMRPDAAAGIMAGLSPQAAYSISVILAGRNADVPKG